MTIRVGEKSRTDSSGALPEGWDHDPPAEHKLTPFGVLNLLTGALMIIFGRAESSDFWGDCLRLWWEQTRVLFPKLKRVIMYLDNGPNNSGRRQQFLKRMIEFADWSGLEIVLAYYPPYHSKYNPIERCWSALENKWSGTLLNSLEVVLAVARRMTWLGRSPVIHQLDGQYPAGVKVSRQEWKKLQTRLERSTTLPKYHIIIRPNTTTPLVS